MNVVFLKLNRKRNDKKKLGLLCIAIGTMKSILKPQQSQIQSAFARNHAAGNQVTRPDNLINSQLTCCKFPPGFRWLSLASNDWLARVWHMSIGGTEGKNNNQKHSLNNAPRDACNVCSFAFARISARYSNCLVRSVDEWQPGRESGQICC